MQGPYEKVFAWGFRETSDEGTNSVEKPESKYFPVQAE